MGFREVAGDGLLQIRVWEANGRGGIFRWKHGAGARQQWWHDVEVSKGTAVEQWEVQRKGEQYSCGGSGR
ncbi:hypothetical protein U1Q18_010015 [Sarracenia purpurea var. burkii]